MPGQTPKEVLPSVAECSLGKMRVSDVLLRKGSSFRVTIQVSHPYRFDDEMLRLRELLAEVNACAKLLMEDEKLIVQVNATLRTSNLVLTYAKQLIHKIAREYGTTEKAGKKAEKPARQVNPDDRLPSRAERLQRMREARQSWGRHSPAIG